MIMYLHVSEMLSKTYRPDFQNLQATRKKLQK